MRYKNPPDVLPKLKAWKPSRHGAGYTRTRDYQLRICGYCRFLIHYTEERCPNCGN